MPNEVEQKFAEVETMNRTTERKIAEIDNQLWWFAFWHGLAHGAVCAGALVAMLGLLLLVLVKADVAISLAGIAVTLFGNVVLVSIDWVERARKLRQALQEAQAAHAEAREAFDRLTGR